MMGMRGKYLPGMYYFLSFFTIGMLFLVFPMKAEAATYTFRSTSFSWESAANNVVWAQSCTGYPIDDDQAIVNIGFTFNFAGINYSQVRIHSNGALQFGADTGFHRHYQNSDLPVTSSPTLGSSWWCAHSQADRLLLAYWDDINPRLGGTVRYETKGIAPNRRFVVSWENVPHYNFGGSYTFQVILYENGEFVYQYGAGNASGASATIGVEVDNNDYTLYSFDLSFSYAGTALLWYQPSGEPERLAEYWMEEGLWNGTPNEIVDWSGNGYRGVRIGNAQTVENGYVCRGAEIPANTSSAVIDAINTNIDVDATIGTSGSITFWYRSNRVWSGSGARDHQLFDATLQNNRWFFLTKRSSGRLRFVLSDSGGSTAVAETGVYATAARAWRHIAVTWRMRAGTNQTVLRVYVDGALSSVSQATTNGSLPSSLGTLYFGDNRSSVIGMNGTGNSADGILDEIRIYNYEISGADVQTDMANTHPCVFVDHLRILHDGSGLTCAPEPVRLVACMDISCSTNYQGNVLVDFVSPANGWSDDPLAFSGGSADVSLRSPVSGSLVLGARALSPATVGETRCFVGGNETCDMEFHDSGFVFNVHDHIADSPQSVLVSAVRKDDVTELCVPGFQNVTRNLRFHSNYLDPIAGSLPVTINGTNITSGLPGTGLPLFFNNQGETTLILAYPDVGQMNLTAEYTGTGDDAGLVMTGTDSFVTRPAYFVLSVPGNPEAATATGNVFKKAGELFDVEVSSRNISGNVTPNFGQEILPESVRLTSSLIAPAGQSNPPLTGSFGGFGTNCSTNSAPGYSCGQFRWNEVGIIRMTPEIADGSYLGSGNVFGNESVNVGRFIPDHFEVSTNMPVFDTACGTFTYAGQPFEYATAPVINVTARNAAGGLTQNYTGDYWKLTNVSLSGKSYSLAGGTLDTALLPAPDPMISDSGGGTGTLTFSSGDGMAIMRNAPVAPFDAEIRLEINLIDSDGVTYPGNPAHFGETTPGQGIAFSGGKNIRYGRLTLENAHGSELLPLSVALQAEYFNGTSFVQNVDDSCTPYAATYLLLDNYSGNLSAGGTTVSGAGNLINAAGMFSLTAPGAGNDGGVRLEYNLVTSAADLPWLQFDWEGDGSRLNPTAKATFGIYKGNPRMIYMRESVW